MADPKQEKAESGKSTEDLFNERQSEATSDETVSDLEETKESSSSASANSDPGPSPDGALDEGDEINDAGPM
jgi:hypothetical protein